jgi:diaminopropionate ammonia-lyase
MSAAIQYLRIPRPTPGPGLLAVEPAAAACALASRRNGRPVTVRTGKTTMAGLNAGTLSSTAWPLLNAGLDAAVAVTEDETPKAGCQLAEAGVQVGSCAAATLAGLTAAGTAALGLTRSSTVVLIATEAATSACNRPME